MRSDEVLKRVQGSTVLDIGCTGQGLDEPGPGWIHGKLRERGGQLVGIDTNAERVAAYRQQGFDTMQVGDAQTFSLAQRFDTIVAGEVIEHLDNPGLFLATARDHLAEGGRIVLTTPYVFSLLSMLYAVMKFPKTCSNPEHTLWLCPETINLLFTRARLRVAEWTLIEDYPPHAGPRTALLVGLMRLLRLPSRLRANCMIYVIVADT